MKAAFVINARNKEKWVAQAVRGALSQTYPCHIILSDQYSTDSTFEVMQTEVETYKSNLGEGKESHHKIEVVRCPIEGKYGMRAANDHVMWLAEQTDAEWIFQSSADDYSLSGRVAACMQAVAEHPCVNVSTTMFFAEPGKGHNPQMISGYPTQSGYVGAGDGLFKMAYGSTIAGFNREWLLKVGSAGDVTPDVYYGFLSAIGEGFYVVAEPHHVHVTHSDLENMGFQGKMRAAEQAGDKDQIARINELNRFQLLDLYFSILVESSELYPMAHQNDKNAILQMVLNQAHGWLIERKNLHELGIAPGGL